MSISYSEASRIFKLDTDNTTYMIGISPEGYAGHIYYGKKIGHFCGAGMLRCNEIPGPSVLKKADFRHHSHMSIQQVELATTV